MVNAIEGSNPSLSANRQTIAFAQDSESCGKRIAIGLGGYPDVTLAEARETALANRRKVRQGEDPR